MRLKRLLLIVNPISGTHSKAELVPKLEEKLEQKGFCVTTRFTKGHGDATEYARQALESRYDTVAVCGGDGTVNECARALCDTDMPMAIIPSGSGNGLARHIGLPSDELASVNLINPENVCACDYGLVNDQKFFCTCGMGFDAAVARKFAEDGHRGLLTYLKNAVKEFAHYNPLDYTITVDGSTTIERKAYLVACCNAAQYGNNAFIAPGASVCDGLFDLIILRDASHLRTLIAGLDMLTGMLTYNHQVEIIRAKKVDIIAHHPTPSHIDGDPVDMGQELHILNVPAKLHLYADLSHEKFKPIITPIDYMKRDITASIAKIFD